MAGIIGEESPGGLFGGTDGQSITTTTAEQSKIAAEASETAAAASKTAAAASATAAATSATGASTSASGITSSVTAAAASATAAQSSEDDAATDLGLTNADVVLTHADVVLTHADVVLTAADVVSAEADKVQTGLDRIAVAADLVATNQDTIDTAADVVLAEADKVQTALDRTAVAADKVLTNADVVLAEADKVQTALDRVATAADAVATASDRTAITTIYDNFDDRYLGTKSSDPSVDNDGNALVTGAMYFNSTVNNTKFYNGSAWEDPEATATSGASTATTKASEASTSASGAATSATAAASSASGAATSATTATTKAAESSASATSAATSASTATTKAATATTQAATATTQATTATSQATLATTKAATATTQATTATTKASEAATSATAAASSASGASTSASGAATSATASASSATAAQSSEDDAATDLALTNADVVLTHADVVLTHADVVLTNADVVLAEADKVQTGVDRAAVAADLVLTNQDTIDTAADVVLTHADVVLAEADKVQTGVDRAAVAADLVLTNADVVLAEADRVSAAASAATATTKAATATTQATTATTQASTATTKASEAATSASGASTSASSAATSLTATTAAKDATLAALDSFDDRYLGVKGSAPSVDNDGNTLATGALYFDSSTTSMKVWSGSAWLAAYASLSGALIGSNNLSDVSNAGTSRTNLGVAIGSDVQAYTSILAGTQQSFTSALKTKLDAIEASATADQTNAEIRAAVEAATDSNAFTDADHTKLNAIEASATADQSNAEIRTAVEAATDSNVFTDADHTKLNAIEASADVTDTANVTAAGALMDSELAGIAAVKATTGTFLTADQTKLDAIEASATADQSNAEIRTAVEAATDSNVFTDADHTKLNAIEASADVTDTANVTSSGALMDSELTNIAAVKALNQSLVTTAGPTIGSLTVDTMSMNGSSLTATGNLTLDAVGDINLDADGGDITFLDAGVEIGRFVNDATDFTMKSLVQDKDIKFMGNDNGGAITALTLDMSAAGAATFNSNIVVGGTVDGIDIAARDAILTSTTTTAGAALPKTGGAMTGAITTNSTFDGVDIAVRDALHAPKASPTFTGTPAAPTASGSTNTTQLATTEFVQQEITTLIGGAPSTLNDLNELAAAINDDANYNSTLTTALATKLPLAGGTMTGQVLFNDGVELRLGTDSDMGLFSSSGTSHVRVNSGVFALRADDLRLVNQANTEMMLTGVANAAVSLYYNGLPKLATTATGIDVTGTATAARLKSTQATVAANGSATTLDFGASNNFLVNMTLDTTFTFSNLSDAIGCAGNIVISQDATGTRDFVLPAQAKTPINGATITQNTGANEISVLSYYVVSATVVLVNYIGDFA